MYVLNHFISGVFNVGSTSISLPQPDAADQTNGPDLISHINSCQSTFKQIPNFVAVDFYQKGSLLESVAKVNKVTWNGKEATGSTSKSSAGPSTAGINGSGANAAAGSLLVAGHTVAGLLASVAGAIALVMSV
jgi:hypothetical protein